ncbi:MAG TPA: DUF4388 domain-containing protein [Ktedonobacteraceae bacterium]|jgi:hypothetical protein|nr:DUF4388 domain-containing protein [Ktedonobacteraceae bacterium]
MIHQHEATTDRLIGIIATIKLERKSGQLRVRRGEGLISEEGLITFRQGQITQASVGRRSGADALNWLSTWGKTRYLFTSLAPDEGTTTGPLSQPASPEDSAVDRVAPVVEVNTDKLKWEQVHEPRNDTPRAIMKLHEATERMERAGLSRSHRRLFLLIDGNRSLDELALLLGKKLDEVRGMLHDLEWLGMIEVVHAP